MNRVTYHNEVHQSQRPRQDGREQQEQDPRRAFHPAGGGGLRTHTVCLAQSVIK